MFTHIFIVLAVCDAMQPDYITSLVQIYICKDILGSFVLREGKVKIIYMLSMGFLKQILANLFSGMLINHSHYVRIPSSHVKHWRQVAGTHWLSSKAKLLGSRFNEKPSLEKKKGGERLRKAPDTVFWLPEVWAPTQASTSLPSTQCVPPTHI